MWKWVEDNFVKPLGDIMYGIEYLQEMFEKSIDELYRVNAITTTDLYNKEKEIADLKVQIAELEQENCSLYDQLYEYTENNEKCTKLDSYAKKSIDDIASIAKDAIESCAVYNEDFYGLRSSINDLQNEMHTSIEKSTNSVTESLQERNEDYQELIECLHSICNGAYNADIVEFFALKTYRGWKYICHDGVSTTDFDDIKGVEVCWKQDGRVRVIYECKDKGDD